MDGLLDDEAWQGADVAADFIQRQPNPGEPATEPTEVRVLYTHSALYIGIRALAARPGQIVGEEMQRDGALFRDDSVLVLLDTFNDDRNAYFFEVNPNGAFTDALVTDEGRDFNVQWDAVWRAVAQRTPEGWSAEMEIPFATLRFDPAKDSWGLNVRRLIRHKNEEVFWASIPLEADLFRISLAGSLTGIHGPEPGLNLRIKPFAVGSASKLQIGEEYNPESGFLLRNNIRRYVPRFSLTPRPATRGPIRNYIFGMTGDIVTDLDNETQTLELAANLFGVTLRSGDQYILFGDHAFDRVPAPFQLGNVVIPAGEYQLNDTGISFQTNNTYIQYKRHLRPSVVNLRFNWQYRPGADLFIVFNQNWSAPSVSDLTVRDRELIVKLTYLFEL